MHRLEARSVDRHHNDGGGLLDGRKRSRALKTRSASTVYTFCERAKKRRRNTDANAFNRVDTLYDNRAAHFGDTPEMKLKSGFSEYTSRLSEVPSGLDDSGSATPRVCIQA